MDDHVYKLLVDKIDQVRDDLKEDINEIKKDVEELLRFKWKVVGMAMVVGVVSAIIFEAAVTILKYKGV